MHDLEARLRVAIPSMDSRVVDLVSVLSSIPVQEDHIRASLSKRVYVGRSFRAARHYGRHQIGGMGPWLYEYGACGLVSSSSPRCSRAIALGTTAGSFLWFILTP